MDHVPLIISHENVYVDKEAYTIQPTISKYIYRRHYANEKRKYNNEQFMYFSSLNHDIYEWRQHYQS